MYTTKIEKNMCSICEKQYDRDWEIEEMQTNIALEPTEEEFSRRTSSRSNNQISTIPQNESNMMILEMLAKMSHEIKQISQEQKELSKLLKKEKTKKCSLAQKIYKQLPVKTFKELRSVEDYLKDENVREELQQILQRYGGRDAKCGTTALLKKVFTDKVAKEFSWVGGKGKRNFSLLECTILITEAVVSSTKSTRYAIQQAIKGWLRHAGDRYNRAHQLGASRTGVPLTSNILSPICNDISSEATSNLETESDEEY